MARVGVDGDGEGGGDGGSAGARAGASAASSAGAAPRVGGDQSRAHRDGILPAGSRARRVTLACLALAGALPTLAWVLLGPALVHDDWNLAGSFLGGGFDRWWDALGTAAWEAPGRPVASLYYGGTYAVFGTSPLGHALALAAVNAALGPLVFLVVERYWRAEVAVWVALVYVVLPNRGSTRLWFAVAPNPLAVALVCVAVLLMARRRWVWASVAIVVAVGAYEGVIGLAACAIVVGVLTGDGPRLRRLLVLGAPLLFTVASLYAISPKRDGSSLAPGGFGRILTSQFGVGIWESATWAPYGFTLSLGLVLCVVVLPTSDRRVDAWRMLVALAVLAAGAAPFLLLGWPLGTSGFFDRANGVPGVGTALVLGLALAWMWRNFPRPVAATACVAVLALLAAGNVSDLAIYSDATDRGAVLLAQVREDVGPTTATVRIIPPPGADGGVAQFVAGSDLAAAVRLGGGVVVDFYLIPAAEERPLPERAVCYDRLLRSLVDCPADGP